jgi:predicted secreted protein
MVMDQDQDRDSLLRHLRLRDCEPRLIAVTDGQGGWRVFVPGAPDIVNQGFPPLLHAGEPLLVQCMRPHPTTRLTEANNGAAIIVAAGTRVRVVLESNASTGYSWIVSAMPDPAVLAPIGEPFFVSPVSALLGAAGHQVFDFQAVAVGTTTLQLAYQRTTIPPEAPVSNWSVDVTVQ